MYLAFDVRVMEMSLKGFMHDSREYFYPSFVLDGVDRNQKLDLTNMGLGADFLSADIRVSYFEEFEGKTFLGYISWAIYPQETHIGHLDDAHHISIHIGLSKSNLDMLADNLKHLRLTKVAIDTDLFVRQGEFEDKLFRFSEPMFSSKEEQYGKALFHDYRFGFEYPSNEGHAVT